MVTCQAKAGLGGPSVVKFPPDLGPTFDRRGGLEKKPHTHTRFISPPKSPEWPREPPFLTLGVGQGPAVDALGSCEQPDSRHLLGK